LFSGEVTLRTRVVLFSDGISGRFSLHELELMHPAKACESVMQVHARNTDDATVMVVDFGG